MGGKAKLLDITALEQIYATSVKFKRISEDITKDMRFKINQLTDPAFLDGLRGSEGLSCIEVIQHSTSQLEELLELATATINSIEHKLADAVSSGEENKLANQDKLDVSTFISNRLSLKR